MATTSWIGFDLDGTAAVYTIWKGSDHIGKPIEPIIKRIKNLIAQGQRVKIFTARVASVHPQEERELAEKAIKAWCKEHIGRELEVTAEKDNLLIEFYDDRAIPVEYNTGVLLI